MALVPWVEATVEDVFGNNRLYQQFKTLFAEKNHNHTVSQITDFEHDHDGRYYTKSQIDSKYGDGNYVLKHTQTSGNLTVNLYSNGVDVYVECNSNEMNITVNANQSTQLMTLTCSSDYFPRNNMYSAMMRGTTSSPRLRITTGGIIYVYNSSSTTSFDCDCGIMYPLKSRFPS